MCCYYYFRSCFEEVNPNSALAIHRKGMQAINSSNNDYLCNSSEEELIFQKSHEILLLISKYPVLDLGKCCREIWTQLIQYDAQYIRKRSATDKSFWNSVRKFRITGSRCYNLYTFGLLVSKN